MNPPITDLVPRPTSRAPGFSSWEGRAFGGIVLAAFPLYGIGSAIADRPLGLLLVVANSIGVALAGLIGFRLVGGVERDVGAGYLAARVAEAVLLLGGILLAEVADIDAAGNDGYLLAMAALAAGSIPFCRALGQRRLLPWMLARWGAVGYAALFIGAGLELVTGYSLAVLCALPGGLFELVLGVRLVWRGFDRNLATERTR